MAAFSFNCPFCNIELEIDESGAGQEIECPGCNEVLIIPSPGAGGGDDSGPVVPTGDQLASATIVKPKSRPLDIAAKVAKKIKLRTFRHHEHVKDGKDHFDADVSKFLAELMEEDIVSVRPIQYTHSEVMKDAEGKESRVLANQYGIVVIFKA